MSHLLDQLRFFNRKQGEFADGHGETRQESRDWENVYRARWQYDKIVPFELESAVKKAGALFEEAPIFENKVIVDGRLITGQNPASAKALGEAVVKALQAKTL